MILHLVIIHVQKICVAYDDMYRYFPKEKLIFTGNPIREDIIGFENRRIENKTKQGGNHNCSEKVQK